MQSLLHSSSLKMILVVSLLVALKVTSFASTQRWTNVIHNAGKLRTNTITQMVRGKGEGEGKKTQSGGGGFGKKSESPKKEVPKDFNWDDMDLNEEAPIDDESMLQEIFRTIDKLNKEQQVDLFGYEIQPMTDYRDELYRADGQWPIGVLEDTAKQYLERSYERSRALPQLFELSMVNEMFVAPKEYTTKRYLGNKELYDWYAIGNHRMGDVCDIHYNPKYSSDIRHSYSSQIYATELLKKGTVHVAVGFTDLGTLLSCRLAEDQTPDAQTLRFIGYDTSAYAVAKSMVIWQMCLQSYDFFATDAEHAAAVVQVWFSTVWTRATERAFIETVRGMCADRDILVTLDNGVASLLLHWADSTGVDMTRAMRECVQGKEGYPSSIGFFLQKQDRLDFARYELTGAFGVSAKDRGDSDGITGSVVMFDCPSDCPLLARDESVFSTLSIADVAKRRTDLSQSLFTSAEKHIQEECATFIKRAKSGEIDVELRCKAVEDSVDEIAFLKPWTMSWSSLVDFFSPKELHRIAQKCSKHGDTLHFGYSTRWQASVVGSSFMDFESQPVKMRQQLVRDSNNAMSSFVFSSNMEALLRTPVPQNPMNTVGFVLEMECYKNWLQMWKTHAEKDDQVGYCAVFKDYHAVPSFLSNGGASTIYFSWTYDEDVNVSF